MQKIEVLMQTQKELQVAKRQKSVHNELIDEFKNNSKQVSNNKKFFQHQSKFLAILDEHIVQNKSKKNKVEQLNQMIKNKEQEQKKGEELVQNIEHRNYFFLEHFYQQLYDTIPDLDYQNHNNNFILYDEVNERIEHVYQLKVQEQEQRNNEINVLNNEISELVKYQADIEQTIQISNKQIQRIEDNIQQNIKTETKQNYQQELNKLVNKQNQYKEKRYQINNEQQEYIKEGVSKITELRVKRQTKENVVVAQLKQIDLLKNEIKVKKATRFDVRNLIRKMEWFVEMNMLLKSSNVPKHIELMSQKEFMDQYLAKIELKKIEKNQLLNRLDSFCKEIGELGTLEQQILQFLRSLHIEYLTLQNRHNDLIIQKKELKKNMVKQNMSIFDIGEEEIDSQVNIFGYLG